MSKNIIHVGRNIGISNEEKLELVREAIDGMNVRDIASKHNLTESTTSHILHSCGYYYSQDDKYGPKLIKIPKEKVIHALEMRLSLESSASYLGISIHTLLRLMKEYDLESPRAKKRRRENG